MNEFTCNLKYGSVKQGNGSVCNSTYDGLLCWPPSKAGVIAKQPCPPYHGFIEGGHAIRKCGLSGEWEDFNSTIITLKKTNYEFCLGTEDLDATNKLDGYSSDVTYNVRTMNIVGMSILSFSLLGVLVALFLYGCILPKFVNTILHVKIYKHIYSAIILDIVCKLTSHMIVYMQLEGIITVHQFSDIVCEVLTSLSHYSEIVLLCWFMLDAHFLQITSKSGYLCASGYFTYWIVGWGLPIVPVTIWIVTVTLSHKAKCWMNHSTLPIIWIVESPKLCFIFVSGVLLFLSLFRLHQDNFKKRIFDLPKVKNELIMTIALFTLISTSFLLIIIPTHLKTDASSVLQYIGIVFTSSRGLFVVLCYAFLNKNVLGYLRHNDARLPCKRYLRMA